MLQLPVRRLHGPGPSPVAPSVLQAIALPCIGHMDPAFMRVMNEIREMLQQVFQTENEMTLACSGTGSAGAEMLMDNLVEPGDVCLIGINGVFGGRLADKARRAGGTVHTMQADWGQVFDQDAIIEKIDELKPTIVAFVHAETSTGALQPFDRLGEAVHRHGGYLIMDCVTSLGGLPVKIDQWQVDAAYSGTQKCLSCPPGLAPVTLSERAMHKVNQRPAPVNSWYLDLKVWDRYRSDWGHWHPHPVTMPTNDPPVVCWSISTVQADRSNVPAGKWARNESGIIAELSGSSSVRQMTVWAPEASLTSVACSRAAPMR
jgi:alanine-glyoxylate transaminase / serine-glyoxylate transaminase / serine-pyruvate transaminase